MKTINLFALLLAKRPGAEWKNRFKYLTDILPLRAVVTGFILVSSIFTFCFCLAAQDEFRYDAKGKRDPFVPGIGPDGRYYAPQGRLKAVGDIKLEGIIWDPEGESFAIINGEIVREGENLDGIKVEKIYSKKVIILMEDREITLNLIEEEE